MNRRNPSSATDLRGESSGQRAAHTSSNPVLASMGESPNAVEPEGNRSSGMGSNNPPISPTGGRQSPEMLLAADVEFSRRYSLAVFKKRRQKEARKRLRKYIRGVLRREREMNIILQRFRQKEFQLMKTLLQDRANVLKDLLKIDDNFEGPAEQVKRSLERFDENGMSMLVDYYDAQNLDRQQILHEYRLMSQLSSQARPDDQSEAYKFLIEAFGLRKLNIAKFAASALKFTARLDNVKGLSSIFRSQTEMKSVAALEEMPSYEGLWQNENDDIFSKWSKFMIFFSSTQYCTTKVRELMSEVFGILLYHSHAETYFDSIIDWNRRPLRFWSQLMRSFGAFFNVKRHLAAIKSGYILKRVLNRFAPLLNCAISIGATIALRFVLDTGEEENKEGATKQEDGQKESTNVTLHKSFAILALGVAVVRGVICFTDLLNLLYRAARVSFIDYKLNSLVATYFRLETVPPKLCTELIIKAVMLCNSEGVSKSRIEKLLASGEEEQENDVAAQGSQTGGVKSGNDIVQDVAAIFAHGFALGGVERRTDIVLMLFKVRRYMEHQNQLSKLLGIDKLIGTLREGLLNKKSSRYPGSLLQSNFFCLVVMLILFIILFFALPARETGGAILRELYSTFLGATVYLVVPFMSSFILFILYVQ